MRYRMLAVLLGLTCSVSLLAAEGDRGRDRDSSGKGKAGLGQAFQGQIQRVDVSKRQLVLTGVRSSTDPDPRETRATTPPRSGGATDRPTTPAVTDRPPRAEGREGNRGAEAVHADRPTVGGQNRMLTFTVSSRADIRLDGRKVSLHDLKPGQRARVWASRSTESNSTSREGSRETTRTRPSGTDRGTADEANRDRRGQDPAWTTQLVEVFAGGTNTQDIPGTNPRTTGTSDTNNRSGADRPTRDQR